MDGSGNIYGTTAYGGSHAIVSGGAGTVWKYDGSAQSGHEDRSAGVLSDLLGIPGIDLRRYEERFGKIEEPAPEQPYPTGGLIS